MRSLDLALSAGPLQEALKIVRGENATHENAINVHYTIRKDFSKAEDDQLTYGPKIENGKLAIDIIQNSRGECKFASEQQLIDQAQKWLKTSLRKENTHKAAEIDSNVSEKSAVEPAT